MNTNRPNLKVSVVIPADTNLDLLDTVLDTLQRHEADIAITMPGKAQADDLHAQTDQWITTVYARSETAN